VRNYLHYLLVLAVVLSAIPLPAFSQRPQDGVTYPNLVPGAGFGSGSGSGSGARAGNRAAPTKGSSGIVTRNYQAEENPDLTPEKALQLQNRAIQQYSNMGYQFEAKKQWENAEKSFKYVLKVSALRDGVGSPKMVPILQHLAIVTSEQEHLPEAIGFQERVLGFAKNEIDPLPIINAGIALSNLYLRQNDFDKAESTIQETYTLSQGTTLIPAKKKLEVAHVFGTLLRKERKEGQAQMVDPLASGVTPKSSESQEPRAVDNSSEKSAVSSKDK
jgi:tetratricopeptide (TPR) repeat protein